MSNYNTEFQSNNADLSAILETINNLPDAGESSGGGYKVVQGSTYVSSSSTVTISPVSMSKIHYIYFCCAGTFGSGYTNNAFIYGFTTSDLNMTSSGKMTGYAFATRSLYSYSLSVTFSNNTVTLETTSSTYKFDSTVYYLIVGE